MQTFAKRLLAGASRVTTGHDVTVFTFPHGKFQQQLQIFLLLAGFACAFLFTGCRYSSQSPPPVASTNGPSPPPITPEIPSFQWPPPQASAMQNLPREFFASAKFLRDVESKLSAALTSSGYATPSHYAVPGGFALVTQLEQINDNGTPKSPPNRWATITVRPTHFTLAEYLTALLRANPGRFRIIVFIVTTKPFKEDTTTVITREQAMQWLPGGVQRLPSSIGDEPFTSEHLCTALVYEFELPETKAKAELKQPSSLTCHDHLTAAELWQHLEH